ncbi:MAG: carbohydrate kinase family protein [Halobacteriota archaeon]
MATVVCAGHVNWDITLRVDRLPEPDGESVVRERTGRGGGSAANVATAMAALGAEVPLVGSLGDDEYGRSTRADLVEAGVDCTHVVEARGASTAVKYLLVEDTGEVAVLGCSGANEAFDAENVPPSVLDSAAHLHLTSQRPATAAKLARRATEAGVRVSFDPGRRLGERDFSRTLSLANVVFLNDREADAALAGGLVPKGRVVVRKRGALGAMVETPTETITHPGFGVDTVNTTGAGDAFAAGFIAAFLDGDRDAPDGYERALAVANACGAIAAGVHGARASPTWDAVESMLDGGHSD